MCSRAGWDRFLPRQQTPVFLLYDSNRAAHERTAQSGKPLSASNGETFEINRIRGEVFKPIFCYQERIGMPEGTQVRHIYTWLNTDQHVLLQNRKNNEL